MTTAKRARKGGEIGINGEHYAGGCFLPTTKLGKMGRAAAKPRPARPWWWKFQPFVGLSFDKSEMKITASDQALKYHGLTRAEVQAACDRYNGGER